MEDQLEQDCAHPGIENQRVFGVGTKLVQWCPDFACQEMVAVGRAA